MDNMLLFLQFKQLVWTDGDFSRNAEATNFVKFERTDPLKENQGRKSK